MHEGVNENNESANACLALDTSIIVNDGLHRIPSMTLKRRRTHLLSNYRLFLINPKKIYGNSLSSRFYILFRNLKPRKVFGLGIEQKIKTQAEVKLKIFIQHIGEKNKHRSRLNNIFLITSSLEIGLSLPSICVPSIPIIAANPVNLGLS